MKMKVKDGGSVVDFGGCIEGVYEYWGIQRVGKSTVMVRDMLRLCSFNGFSFDDVYANFGVFLPGVHCGSSDWLMREMCRIFDERLRHKIFMFDELGQFLGARNYKDKYQTKLANDLWQYPKRDLIFMYSDNVGNSADIVIRLATWETICPQFFEGDSREGDYIVCDIIKNYMGEVVKGVVIPEVWLFQRLFNTRDPVF